MTARITFVTTGALLAAVGPHVTAEHLKQWNKRRLIGAAGYAVHVHDRGPRQRRWPIQAVYEVAILSVLGCIIGLPEASKWLSTDGRWDAIQSGKVEALIVPLTGSDVVVCDGSMPDMGPEPFACVPVRAMIQAINTRLGHV